MDVIAHYDLLVDENNDPFYDSPELKDYMNKWDGQVFIDALQLDENKEIIEKVDYSLLIEFILGIFQGL